MDIPFPKDCIVKIYAFINNQESASVLSSLYYSETEGTLNADQDPMIMQAANYNFFAVSLKMDSIPPTFYNNEATGLLNGIDYLWAGTTDINVNTNKQVISLTFTHSATQLYFTIDNQSSDTIISKIESATINVVSPTSDASWGLMTGVISQISGDPDISGTVTIDSLSFNTICLPFIPSSNPEVTIHAYTNHNDYILMTLQAPTPDSGFVSGHSYQYEIAYAPENIVVKNVVVAPWQDVIKEPNINVPR